MKDIKAVYVDGALYFCVAVFTATQAAFGTDEAYKYVSPYILFWVRTVSGILAAGTLAVKMFRSTGYSDSLRETAAAQKNTPAV